MIACSMLADVFAKRVPAAYAVFLEKQCLEFLETARFMWNQFMSSASAVLDFSPGYTDWFEVIDATTLQQHVDHVYEPQNLFTVCSIPVIQEGERIDRTGAALSARSCL
ncbi:uncharacterized protein ARMOST_08348 [Armillaria ostoyae]|uniref:Uncharacterized protein n=1 Tax=Armillaria ostoyae TaxID=47428 RepID=A0A284R8B8_ARMOS|nr:uncharacterized protein ARMOST_08348 [Armillaria ostoyae]